MLSSKYLVLFSHHLLLMQQFTHCYQYSYSNGTICPKICNHLQWNITAIISQLKQLLGIFMPLCTSWKVACLPLKLFRLKGCIAFALPKSSVQDNLKIGRKSKLLCKNEIFYHYFHCYCYKITVFKTTVL